VGRNEIAGDALGSGNWTRLFARIPDGDLIVGFRNVLAHGYATLDHRRVHSIASTKVALLGALLQNLLSEFPETDSQP
jgi:hypothetical protein